MTANIPQDFLFRLRFPCRRVEKSVLSFGATGRFSAEALASNYRVPFWTQNEAPDRFASHSRVPRSSTPRSSENENRFDFRIGWAPQGLVFTAVVRGKRRFVRRTHTDLSDADCVRLCLDARDVKEARRAGKFCYKLLFYPFVGESDEAAKPLAQQTPIGRAKETSNPVEIDAFRLATETRADGYSTSAFLPATAVPGFEPADFSRLGLHFSVRDDEFGSFDLQHSALFPVEEDPSLWPTFDFVDE